MPHHLIQYMASKMGKGIMVSLPTDDASAQPLIDMMNEDKDQERLTEDGELSDEEVQAKMDPILRAKGDLELILGHKITLDNY